MKHVESGGEFTDLGSEMRRHATRRTRAYLNRSQVEEYLGLAAGSLSRIKLPAPDVVIGPVDADGTIPRGTVRGWLPATIDRWNAQRPGRGARTDLQ